MLRFDEAPSSSNLPPKYTALSLNTFELKTMLTDGRWVEEEGKMIYYVKQQNCRVGNHYSTGVYMERIKSNYS